MQERTRSQMLEDIVANLANHAETGQIPKPYRRGSWRPIGEELCMLRVTYDCCVQLLPHSMYSLFLCCLCGTTHKAHPLNIQHLRPFVEYLCLPSKCVLKLQELLQVLIPNCTYILHISPSFFNRFFIQFPAQIPWHSSVIYLFACEKFFIVWKQ